MDIKHMKKKKKTLSITNYWGFPCGSAGKESACNAGDLDLIPGWGRSPGEGKGYPLQCSGLEKSMGSQRDTTEPLSVLKRCFTFFPQTPLVYQVTS